MLQLDSSTISTLYSYFERAKSLKNSINLDTYSSSLGSTLKLLKESYNSILDKSLNHHQDWTQPTSIVLYPIATALLFVFPITDTRKASSEILPLTSTILVYTNTAGK